MTHIKPQSKWISHWLIFSQTRRPFSNDKLIKSYLIAASEAICSERKWVCIRPSASEWDQFLGKLSLWEAAALVKWKTRQMTLGAFPWLLMSLVLCCCSSVTLKWWEGQRLQAVCTEQPQVRVFPKQARKSNSVQPEVESTKMCYSQW